jgi:hypothetical protein
LTKNNSFDLENKIYSIEKNYNFYLKIASLNKKKLLLRNSAVKLFKETAEQIERL